MLRKEIRFEQTGRDETMDEIKKLQAELEHRKEAEHEAEKLICQCRFVEAIALLDALEDAKLKEEGHIIDTLAEERKTKTAGVKTEGITEYRKSITADDSDVYAEIKLRLEGLTDEGTEELYRIFNKFYEQVEKVVHKETSIVAGMGKESQPQVKKS